jgi:tyrosyl-tRNA synthetase
MKIDTNSKKIEEILGRGVEEIIIEKHLRKRLFSGDKLTIKFGVDPSRPDIHLGHTIPLRKLQQFQELGHKVVFIVGDFTGRIGDPSHESKIRPQLSIKEVNENSKTYIEQAGKVIDMKKIEVRRNSEWYDAMKPDDFIRLFSKVTLARILERDDFEKRIKKAENKDSFSFQPATRNSFSSNNLSFICNFENKSDERAIYPHEILYPILQAYDSVIVNSDIEIGGTDQKFNMLMGRTLQERFDKLQQDVITFPLLVGLDGEKKMSKSLDNYIGVTEAPKEQFGKVMSIPDNLIFNYFKLATNIAKDDMKEIRVYLSSDGNPKNVKVRLAKEIVTMYHGAKDAEKAEQEFNRIFQQKKIPEQIPEVKIKEKEMNILDLLVKIKLAISKAEAKRLVIQKGIKIDKEVYNDWQGSVEIKKGMIFQRGKRGFVKIG